MTEKKGHYISDIITAVWQALQSRFLSNYSVSRDSRKTEWTKPGKRDMFWKEQWCGRAALCSGQRLMAGWNYHLVSSFFGAMQNSRGWSVLWNKWCKTGEVKWAGHHRRFQAYLPPNCNRKRDTQHWFQRYKRSLMYLAIERIAKSDRNISHYSFLTNS
jgi:hypothetical protein